jgi:hypothetical protein
MTLEARDPRRMCGLGLSNVWRIMLRTSARVGRCAGCRRSPLSGMRGAVDIVTIADLLESAPVHSGTPAAMVCGEQSTPPAAPANALVRPLRLSVTWGDITRVPAQAGDSDCGPEGRVDAVGQQMGSNRCP